MSQALSYSSGESGTPLLGDTIGANFDATVRAFGDRDALVDRPAGRRWTYAELAADVDALALGGPNAIAEAKRLIRTVSRVSMDEGFAYAEAKIAELFASPEAAEGMMAFATKRKPSWAE